MSTARRIRIGLVFATDFQGYPPGGAGPTIEIFLKGTHTRPFDVWLFGLTTSPKEVVGQVHTRTIYGREYPFVPLFRIESKNLNRRPPIPIRVQAFWSYMRRRRLIDAQNFDLLYLHGPETLPLLIPKRQRVLYHFHGPEEKAAEFSRYSVFRTSWFFVLYRRAIRAILERGDSFIVIDPETFNSYTSRVPHRKERFHLFPTAIDVEQFRPLVNFDRAAARSKFGLPALAKVVLYVGRLSWRKGIDLLLRAFPLVLSQIPDAHLAIAGTGEDRAQVEGLVRELGIQARVSFLGQLPHLPSQELPHLMNCADVSVVSSIQESLALVISEALACGTPVVSTPVGIAPDVIRDGVTGFLVRSREPQEMADRIVRILRDRTCKPEECVAAAQRYAETSLPICDVIQSLCSLEQKSTAQPA